MTYIDSDVESHRLAVVREAGDVAKAVGPEMVGVLVSTCRMGVCVFVCVCVCVCVRWWVHPIHLRLHLRLRLVPSHSACFSLSLSA
jgi:hypothetical protein